MKISVSALRQNIYRLLDQVIETGVPIEIDRKGKKVRIVPGSEHDKLTNLKRRRVIKCEPGELVHIDWSSEWKP